MRTAVFVDAGYLYSAGSKLLSGNALPRSSVRLDLDAALKALRDAVDASSPFASLLRIYWYDGMPRTGPTAEQQALADADDVKLRLGVIAYKEDRKVSTPSSSLTSSNSRATTPSLMPSCFQATKMSE